MMNPPIESLDNYKRIYVPSFVIYPDGINGKYSVALTESGPEAKLKKVIVSDVPENTILLNLHKYSNLNIGMRMKEIINDECGVFKCCDYLMISAENGKLHLIYIEMKSKKIERGEIIKQFKGASCFIGYCNAIIEYFYDTHSQKAFSIDTSYALLSWRNLNKTPTTKKHSYRKNKYRKSLSPEEYIHRTVGSNDSGNVPFEWFLTGV